MRLTSILNIGIAVAAILGLSGCAGVNTFSATARAGDTVAISLGWNQPVSRQTLLINITGAGGLVVSPAARLVANFYPDPASRLIVGRETNQSLGVNANTLAQQLEGVTSNDKDYVQTMVLVDLPADLPVGTATIRASTTANPQTIIATAYVNVIASGGGPHTLQGPTGLPATPDMLGALERADVKTVTFTLAGSVPHAIQLDLTYTPGSGTPWVVNPRGDVKSVSWSNDGSRIRLILMPANQVTPTQLLDFKFFVAGGMTALVVDASSVKAFDASGNPVPGLTAQLN